MGGTSRREASSAEEEYLQTYLQLAKSICRGRAPAKEGCLQRRNICRGGVSAEEEHLRRSICRGGVSTEKEYR